MRALQLRRATQRLFQRVDRVQRNSFLHAAVKFRLPENGQPAAAFAGDTLTASLP